MLFNKTKIELYTIYSIWRSLQHYNYLTVLCSIFHTNHIPKYFSQLNSSITKLNNKYSTERDKGKNCISSWDMKCLKASMSWWDTNRLFHITRLAEEMAYTQKWSACMEGLRVDANRTGAVRSSIKSNSHGKGLCSFELGPDYA